MTAPRFDLNGRTAIVTGGSKGLGASICLALAGAGASVLAVARDEAALSALSRRNQLIRGWAADVTDPEFPAMLEREDFHILVNNAGINFPNPIQAVSLSDLDQMLALNVRAPFLASQAAVRSLLRNGSSGCIINISSQMGHVGSPNRTVYCMTKHAIEGLTKALAVEAAPHGIRVNTVAPTFVETQLTHSWLADAKFREFVDRMIPMGRLGRPDDVAWAVLYLASPMSSMVTGTSLIVDGGWTAQ